MSEYSKAARSANKAKAHRLANADPHQIVDASGWTAPEPLNTDAKVGLRPVSRRAYRSGGSVAGAAPSVNAGKKARKSGGTVASYATEDTKAANAEKFGKPHIGGYKRGGSTRKADGGSLRRYVGNEEVTADDLPSAYGVARPKTGTERDEGGKLRKSNPVVVPERKASAPEVRSMPRPNEQMSKYQEHRRKNPLTKPKLGIVSRALNALEKKQGYKKGGEVDGVVQGTRPTGGRKARAEGGRTKSKGTNINIIIAGQKSPEANGGMPPMPPPQPMGAMPPPPPPPPGPPPGAGAGPGMPPPPMGRKSGGRANPRTSGYMNLEAGANSGLGRLQQAKGKKPS